MTKIVAALFMVFVCHLLNAQPRMAPDRESSSETTGIYLLKVDSASLLIWGLIIAVLIVVGFLVFRFFKNTEEKNVDLVIKNVSPNPSHGPITIEIQGKASQLKILNLAGQTLGAFAVTGGNMQFDLSSMPRGKYIVVAFYGGAESNAVQFTLE
ncbi:MAG: T9SS type A sorting domain-containing protein [Chitinophagales bacterium]